jgi:hypothetical protein
MKSTLNYFQLFCCLLIAVVSIGNTTAQNQRDPIKQDSVVVIVPTNPSLSEGRKIEILPQMDRLFAPPPVFTYNTIDKFAQTDKHVNVLPPVDFKQGFDPILPNGFAALGYGNLNALTGNLYLANSRSLHNAYGMRYNHFSTNVPNSFKDFGRNEFGAFGKIFKAREEFGVSVDYQRSAFRFYNIPDSIEIASRKDVTRYMENWNFNTYYQNGDINATEYRPFFRFDVNFDRFNMTGNQYENTIGGKGHFRKNIQDGILDVYLIGEYDQLKTESALNRTFITLKPRYKKNNIMDIQDLEIVVGVNFTVYADSLQPVAYINPVVNISYPLLDKKVVLIAGTDGEYQRQNLSDLYHLNPFLQNNQRIENKFVNLRLYGGFNAKIAPSANFIFQVKHETISNMPLFVGTDDSLGRFALMYADGRIASVSGRINYTLGNKAWVNLIATYYDYEITHSEEAWQMPDYTVKLRGNYIMNKKLVTRADILMLGNRTHINLESNEQVNLKPVFDLNLGADYQLGETFFMFTQLNNIAGTLYQRWYNYPAYGFNATIGLGARF